MNQWRIQIDELAEDFREIRVTWMGIPSRVLDILNEENADEVIASLTGPVRASFLEWARELSLCDDDDIISFGSPDGKPTLEKREKFRIVRAWVAAHPLRARSEPFPVDLVKGLLPRVDRENRRLLALIGGTRGHPERERSRRATSVVVDLENALRQATEGPIGSQAQAFAWEVLDRALRNVEALIELTEEEQNLIAVAKARQYSSES